MFGATFWLSGQKPEQTNIPNIIVSGNTFTVLYKVTSMSNRMWQLHQIVLLLFCHYCLTHSFLPNVWPMCTLSPKPFLHRPISSAGRQRDCWLLGNMKRPYPATEKHQVNSKLPQYDMAERLTYLCITFTYRLKPKLGYDLHENGFMDSDLFHS